MTIHDLHQQDYPYGWTCPKCERVWAPTVRECELCNRTQYQPLTNANYIPTYYPVKETKDEFADGKR